MPNLTKFHQIWGFVKAIAVTVFVDETCNYVEHINRRTFDKARLLVLVSFLANEKATIVPSRSNAGPR